MIRFLLFAIVFYYLFKFLSKVFGVFIINKAQKQYSGSHQNYSSGNPRREGEINIKYKPKDNKTHVKGGDYVDFEEVEE